MERLDELGLPAAFLLAVLAPECWQEVEAAIERLRGLGLAATREEVDDVYVGRVAASTGRPRANVLAELWEAVERA